MSGLAPKGKSTGDRLAAYLLSGMAGGAALGLWAMIQAARAGIGLWAPMNIITAVLFPDLRPVDGSFDAQSTVTGFALHLYISSFWGVAFGFLADLVVDQDDQDSWELLALGAGFGMALWFVMGLLIGRTLAPELQEVRFFDFFFSHVLYGFVAALTLRRLNRAPTPSPARPPVRRKQPPTSPRP